MISLIEEHVSVGTGSLARRMAYLGMMYTEQESDGAVVVTGGASWGRRLRGPTRLGAADAMQART